MNETTTVVAAGFEAGRKSTLALPVDQRIEHGAVAVRRLRGIQAANRLSEFNRTENAWRLGFAAGEAIAARCLD